MRYFHRPLLADFSGQATHLFTSGGASAVRAAELPELHSFCPPPSHAESGHVPLVVARPRSEFDSRAGGQSGFGGSCPIRLQSRRRLSGKVAGLLVGLVALWCRAVWAQPAFTDQNWVSFGASAGLNNTVYNL